MRIHVPGERSALSPGSFLVRGLAVGLAAGLVAFLVAFALGEPYVEQAIALEETAASTDGAPAGPTDGHGHTHPAEADGTSHEHDGVVVDRTTQRTWGLLTGTVAIGIALGGLVALLAAAAVGRLGTLTARQSTAVVALVGFVAVALVPFLKYPATPPAVGSAETIGARTGQYFGFLLVSVLTAALAVHLATRLGPRIGGFAASTAVGTAYLLVMVAIGHALPTATEVGDFPADTLWFFRRGSLATLAALWAAIGVGLVASVGRLHDRAVADAERRALAASL